jgi:hypothetical protein
MTTTGIVVTACFITLGIYDLIVVMRRGVGCSVSRFMQQAGFKSPIVSVVIGMLIGHFFMYMPPECPPPTAFDFVVEKDVVMMPCKNGSMYLVPLGITVHFEDNRIEK